MNKEQTDNFCGWTRYTVYTRLGRLSYCICMSRTRYVITPSFSRFSLIIIIAIFFTASSTAKKQEQGDQNHRVWARICVCCVTVIIYIPIGILLSVTDCPTFLVFFSFSPIPLRLLPLFLTCTHNYDLKKQITKCYFFLYLGGHLVNVFFFLLLILLLVFCFITQTKWFTKYKCDTCFCPFTNLICAGRFSFRSLILTSPLYFFTINFYILYCIRSIREEIQYFKFLDKSQHFLCYLLFLPLINYRDTADNNFYIF